MKLNVLERLKLLQILPWEGTFATLRIVRKLREALSFSGSELRSFGITEEGGMTRWARNGEREYTFGQTARSMIVGALKALDAAGKLSLDLESVAAKFLDAPADDEVVSAGPEPTELTPTAAGDDPPAKQEQLNGAPKEPAAV